MRKHRFHISCILFFILVQGLDQAQELNRLESEFFKPGKDISPTLTNSGCPDSFGYPLSGIIGRLKHPDRNEYLNFSLVPNPFTIIPEIRFWESKQAYNLYIIIIILFAFYILRIRTRSLRRSNRVLREKEIAAKEITRQKDMLSRRNKNIEDSLNYAQRIQKAMFTTKKQFLSILPDSFILHRPKDIVSGDFYWISENEDKVFLAAIDCTGHGVPGAFMSLIGFELFRKIINTQKIHEPAEILNTLNDNFNEIFGNEEDMILKDGMDLAFCVLHKNENFLEFAGAINPLYLIRENRIIELKGDQFSVGANSIDMTMVSSKFTNHKVMLEKGDLIYLFSDGYADQFGGPEMKKFKYRRFRHILLTIHKFALEKQQSYLEDSIDSWKGSFEQTDDILVIGLKPRVK